MFFLFVSHIHYYIQVDSAANVQPEDVEDVWNLRGILNTSWHRVNVQVGHSNDRAEELYLLDVALHVILP